MENTSDVNRKIVLGLGNTLNRDEGLGVHALKALEQHIAGQAPGVEFLDGGTLGLNLLPWVEEASHLLVLDSMVSRLTLPGQVMELAKEPAENSLGQLSQHTHLLREFCLTPWSHECASRSIFVKMGPE